MKWIIKDWAGNKLYKEREFDTFDDAWDLIRADHPDEEEHQEFYVVPVE